MEYKGFEGPKKDLFSIIKYHERRNEQLLHLLLGDGQMSQLLQFAQYLLEVRYQETIDKQEHGTYFVEMYTQDFVQSKLYGLELHKLKEFFLKGDDYISREVFVVVLFQLLHCQPDEGPFVLNAARELFTTILKRKETHPITFENQVKDLTLSQLDSDVYHTIPMIKFQDFLGNYMLHDNPKNVTGDKQHSEIHKGNYSITEPKTQNKYLHKGDIKKIIFAGTQIAVSEEGLDEILLFDHHFVFASRLQFEPSQHNSRTLIILDFGYSESRMEFAATLQDNSLAFWADKKEKTIYSSKMHLKILFIELLKSWVSVTTANNVVIWNGSQENEIKLNMENSKIQQLFEIPSKRIICILTDVKKIHLFTYQFTQKLLTITDIFIFQSVQFNVPMQSFYTTNYSNVLQRWALEETSTDFTKDTKHTICKQEFTVLAFKFIMQDTLLVTYDSSSVLRVFETSTFKLICSFSKLVKKTSQMYIVELCHNKLALVGQRIHIFQLKRKTQSDVPTTILKSQQTQQFRDRQTEMTETRDLLKALHHLKPRIVKKMSTLQIDKADKLRHLLTLKMMSLEEVEKPLTKVKSEGTLSQSIPVSTRLQQLEEQRYFLKIKQNEDKPNQTLLKMREEIDNPNEYIRKIKLTEPIKKILNSLDAVDQRTQHTEESPNNHLSINRRPQKYKSQYSKPKNPGSHHTDYINYFNLHSDDQIAVTSERQRNQVKKTILKSLQNGHSKMDSQKRLLFNQIVNERSTLITENSQIEHTWLNNKSKILKKHAQQFPPLKQNQMISFLESSNASRYQPPFQNKVDVHRKSLRIENSELPKEGKDKLKEAKKYMEIAQQAIRYLQVENDYMGIQ